MLRNKTFHSLSEIPEKSEKSPAQVVLGNLSFSILSIRAHQLGAFIAAFCGAEHGGLELPD